MYGTDEPSVALIGLGASYGTLTGDARAVLEKAALVIGAKRLLASLPENVAGQRAELVDAARIAETIAEAPEQAICVVYSGDTGFYSGASGLIPLLEKRHIPFRIYPGLSSVQMLAARLGEAWQDWTLCSAHGVSCDPVSALTREKPVLFLTGTTQTPATICGILTDAGLGFLRVRVGENLFCAGERVTEMTAAECAGKRFAPLSVLLVEQAPVPYYGVSGFADADFIRGNVPMTKAVVRAAVCAVLRVRQTETVWDVGAGTGSVSVSLSALTTRGHVYAVEYREEALSLIRQNRDKFRMWNLHVVPGKAPDALRELPAPDAVFIGGSSGNLEAVVDTVLAANRAARVCVTAIALETLEEARRVLSARGMKPDVTQVAVSYAKEAGTHHLMTAHNPVFLITANGEENG